MPSMCFSKARQASIDLVSWLGTSIGVVGRNGGGCAHPLEPNLCSWCSLDSVVSAGLLLPVDQTVWPADR